MTKAKSSKFRRGDPAAPKLQQHIDAIVEFVHVGLGHLLDPCDTYRLLAPALEPNCCANFEYRFAWNHECNPDTLDINWKRPRKGILRKIVKQSRMEAIQSGAELTAREKRAYRLEVARNAYGYVTAQERLGQGIDCQWIDLSYVKDCRGRTIYFIEMGEADTTTDEDIDAMSGGEFVDWHRGVWNWKAGPLTVYGPFQSEDEAEAWMAENGAFDDE